MICHLLWSELNYCFDKLQEKIHFCAILHSKHHCSSIACAPAGFQFIASAQAFNLKLQLQKCDSKLKFEMFEINLPVNLRTWSLELPKQVQVELTLEALSWTYFGGSTAAVAWLLLLCCSDCQAVPALSDEYCQSKLRDTRARPTQASRWLLSRLPVLSCS